MADYIEKKHYCSICNCFMSRNRKWDYHYNYKEVCKRCYGKKISEDK